MISLGAYSHMVNPSVLAMVGKDGVYHVLWDVARPEMEDPFDVLNYLNPFDMMSSLDKLHSLMMTHWPDPVETRLLPFLFVGEGG